VVAARLWQPVILAWLSHACLTEKIRTMLISPAFAQTAGAAQEGSTAAAMFAQFAPLVLIFGVFYFLLIRPQQRRAKEHKARIDAVKKGDQVVTGGGLVGKVVRVDDSYVDVELGQGVKVKAVKSTLTDVLSPGATPAND
jgi:preprotein translocase subunit YajC